MAESTSAPPIPSAVVGRPVAAVTIDGEYRANHERIRGYMAANLIPYRLVLETAAQVWWITDNAGNFCGDEELGYRSEVAALDAIDELISRDGERADARAAQHEGF